jgi:hypothetical protein
MDMFGNSTVRTVAASLAALLLAVSTLGGSAAAAVDTDQVTPSTETDPADASASAGPPCTDGGETIIEVGPVRAYHEPFFCLPLVEYDDDWSPSDGVSTANAKPECSETSGEDTVGPLTVGISDLCRPYVEVHDQATAASGPPCSDDGTVAEVGPLHVYREGFFCEPRVDYDHDWQPGDEVSSTDSHDLDHAKGQLVCILEDADTPRELFWCVFGHRSP